MSQTRRLAAILAADVAGYSRLMEADEAGTARMLREHRAAAEPLLAEHGGRIVNTAGDGMLIEFGSVVSAAQCAIALQKAMAERNAGIPEDRRMELRIGVHLGDVLVEGDDILGDGVNIAARLEALAEPGGICLSDDALRQVQGKVATEFIDMGEQSLKNIVRSVRVYRAGPRASGPNAGATPTVQPAAPALALPQKPSIAVLPFQNLSGDPEQDYFADGMVEEIITALSRIRWLFVIARNSSFTYKGQAVHVKRVGRELGVRYVLEGSVRKAGGRVRITAQLVEAESGAHLWADRFDGSLEDVFDLQDKVAISVAGVIEPTLVRAETGRSARRPTADLTAYDLYLRAWEERLFDEKDRFMPALALLDSAIGRDPNFAPALALAANCHQLIDLNNLTDDPTVNRRAGLRLARQALQSGTDDPVVLTQAGYVLGWFGEDIDAALRLLERGLALNPSYAFGWRNSGWLNLYAGRTKRAIEHFETSLRLDPRGRRGVQLTGIGIAHFFDRDFDEALEKLVSALEEMPSFISAYRFLVGCYAHMGRLREAGEVVDRLRNMNPAAEEGSARYATVYRNPEHRELFLSGLRRALGEEAR